MVMMVYCMVVVTSISNTLYDGDDDDVEHKAVKLMNHRRPKKRTPADKRHKGAEYPPLPTPPPEYTVVSK